MLKTVDVRPAAEGQAIATALELGTVFEPGFKQAQDRENDERDNRRGEREARLSGSRGHANGRIDPDCGGGRHSVHAAAVTEDRASAEKADARDDLGRDAVGGAARILQKDRRDREQRGAERDEDVGAKPGGFATQFALDAEYGAQSRGQEQSRVPARRAAWGADVILSPSDPPILKLSDIAARLDCRLEGDGAVEITRVAAIDRAGPGELTFLANARYHAHLATTRASAVIVGDAQSIDALHAFACSAIRILIWRLPGHCV